MSYKPLAMGVCLIVMLCANSMGEMGEKPVTSESTIEDVLNRLSKKTVFFGHKSVGENILSGVKEIIGTLNTQVSVVEIDDGLVPENLEKGAIAHFKIGENRKPKLKIDEFERLLDKNKSRDIDIALFKFCYVDITEQTDVRGLFQYYKEKMKAIVERHPGIAIGHVTVPLEWKKVPYLYWIKIFLSANWDYKKYLITHMGNIWRTKSNVKRNEFNKMLREEYGGKEPIFDLAYHESTLPDGQRVWFEHKGERYHSLSEKYTSDGGHLNALGRERLAKELLNFLADLKTYREDGVGSGTK